MTPDDGTAAAAKASRPKAVDLAVAAAKLQKRYGRIWGPAIIDRDLNLTELRTLAALGLFADLHGCAFPSIGRLAKATGGIDKRHIKRALKKLEARGYLRRDSRDQRSNVYWLTGLDRKAGGEVATGAAAVARNPPPGPGAQPGTARANVRPWGVAESATRNNPTNNQFKNPVATAKGRTGLSRVFRRTLQMADWKVVSELEGLTQQPKGRCAAYVGERVPAGDGVRYLDSLRHNAEERRLILDDFWRWSNRAEEGTD
jgi:DNA-binding MarR family transcriptional regulator